MNILRMTRKLLLPALLAGALAACGQSSTPAALEKLPQISEEIQQGAEAAQPAKPSQPAKPAADAIAPFELPLESALPRGITYASLEWTVSAAVIDNHAISLFGGSDKRTDKYRAARITLKVKNPLTGFTKLESDVVKLRLGDGKLYEADETGRVQLPGGNAETESKLIFRVPVDATWQGAQLVISESKKIPAELPLEGAPPAAAYPMALSARGEATAEKVVYTILDASLDLDLHAQRAKEGQRFLKLKVRVQNNSTGGGGLPLGDDFFRLVVDGAPLAPADDLSQLIKPGSAYEALVVFAVPADLTAAELRVGEGSAAAAIPLTLNK